MNTTGFPSPAQGYESKSFDFNKIIVTHPAATFTMQYNGSDLEKYNILFGDLIIVDCTIIPHVGSLAVIKENNTFVCREITAIEKTPTGKIYSYLSLSNKTYICKELFGCVSTLVRKYDHAY